MKQPSSSVRPDRLLAGAACVFLAFAGTVCAQTSLAPLSATVEQLQQLQQLQLLDQPDPLEAPESLQSEFPQDASVAPNSELPDALVSDAASIPQCIDHIQFTGEVKRLTSAQASTLKNLWCEVSQGYGALHERIDINRDFNAAVVDGSYLQVGTALLKNYASFAKGRTKGQKGASADDLLRFTLAHELGHAVKKHNGKKKLREISWKLSAFFTGIAPLAVKSKLKKGLVLAGGSALTYAAYCNSFNGVVRAELEADLFALDRLHALGHDALAAGRGLIGLMNAKKVDQESPQCINWEAVKNMTPAEWKVTVEARNPHPSAAERLAQMNEWGGVR